MRALMGVEANGHGVATGNVLYGKRSNEAPVSTAEPNSLNCEPSFDIRSSPSVCVALITRASCLAVGNAGLVMGWHNWPKR